jgi:class 3 adenylate cyclase
MASMQRRLAAILHADLAGFTRMMEGAEALTFQNLKASQNEVLRPAIVECGGRLVGTAGDAVLAEFGSAVAAVGAAIDIQERMARFNDSLPAEQRMQFRIGVHLGEVIVDEDRNIFGDGVNLAARIQELAEPDGIAVSRAVRDVVELKVDYAFADAGNHQLKDMDRAIQLFHVRAVKSAVANTTSQMLPKTTLRFEGLDPAGRSHAFEVALDRLAALARGMIIGRAAEQCDLVVAHTTVSRRHARLSMQGEALQIEDLGSTNGTAVNDMALSAGAAVALQAESRLRLGAVDLLIRRV